jgi:metallophosphoesterase superfamily enzyme
VLSTRGRAISKPCFLLDSDRLILPAFGTYTGGMRSDEEPLTRLMRAEALAILTGKTPRPMPMPRGT